MRLRRGRFVIAGMGLVATTAAAATLLASSAAGAGPTASLRVQVAPGAISQGQPALAIGTFTNNRSFTLSHVSITFTFPAPVAVTAPGCTPSSGTTGTVSCPLGQAGGGAAVRAIVSFVASTPSGSFQVGGRGAWGLGNDAVTATSTPAQIFATSDPTHASACATGPGSLDAELNGQGTELPSLPVADPSLGLPCTPLAVGVLPRPVNSTFGTDIASVDLPRLKTPAEVKLTFRDGELPGSPANPNPLRELSNTMDPNLATSIVVPACQNGGKTIPSGFDACIIGTVPDDPDGDADAGVITLRVQGSGFGDPRFVG
jgi:hypothetical protein